MTIKIPGTRPGCGSVIGGVYILRHYKSSDQYLEVDIFVRGAYNMSMIQTPPRLSTMRTMAGSLFLGEKHEGTKETRIS